MFNLTLAYRLQIYLVEFFWKRWPKMRFFWYLVSAWSISDFLHEATVAWRVKNDFNDFWEKLCSEDFGPKMTFAKNQCMELLWFFCMKLQQYKVLKLTQMVFCKKSFTRVFGQKGAQNELREFYKKIVPLNFFDFLPEVIEFNNFLTKFLLCGFGARWLENGSRMRFLKFCGKWENDIFLIFCTKLNQYKTWNCF